MDRRKFYIVLSLVIVVLAVAMIVHRQPAPSAPIAAATIEELVPNKTLTPVTESPTAAVSATESATAPATAPATVAVDEDQEFQAWMQSEAKSLDLPSVNSKRKTVELGEVVAKLTPTQTRHLRVTTLNASAPAGERVLSAYLLVESGPLGREELVRAIVAPLNDNSPQPAHSEGEIRGQQDKSLRIMMIDGLFSRAQKDPAAREALARAANESEDQFVRIYAQRRLAEL